jgi:hypothetical protein
MPFLTRLSFWLMRFLIKYSIVLLIAYFFVEPDASKHYEGFFNGFFIGGLHGGMAIQNKIISFFDGRLIMAQSYSTLYIIVWWVSLIISIIDDINSFRKAFFGSLLDNLE